MGGLLRKNVAGGVAMEIRNVVVVVVADVLKIVVVEVLHFERE